MAKPDSRKIEYLKVSELVADPRNPKAHATAEVKASIERFGFIEPIALDGRTGYIISGHGRTEVLAQMEREGENPPSGVKLDDEGRWTVPVIVGWESRTDSDAAGALIALNRTTEVGGWVDDSLLELLDDLSDMEEGLQGVGFEAEDIEKLQVKLDELGANGEDDDTIGNDSVADGVTYAEKFELVIDCEDERDQEIKYQQLVEAGFTPRALAL